MTRILIVEDEPDLVYSIKKGLSRNGFEVDAFDDPLDALKEFKPNVYDVLILDIRLPKMNGFELYREIKKSGDKSIIFFITAFEIYYEEFKKIFPELDVRYFIKKPIAISNLAETINEALKANVAK